MGLTINSGGKMEKIYITGHKVPDTDSICSAIAYAELLTKIGKYNAEPIRLGDLNNETKFVLDYFNVEAPRLKESIQLKVHDLELDEPIIIYSDTPIKKAIELIQSNGAQLLSICDEHHKLKGVLTLSDITSSYMNIWDDMILHRSNTSLNNIVDVLSAKVLNAGDHALNGKMVVYAMEPDALGDRINAGDVVIVGDRDDAQLDAIKRKVSLIIVSGGYEMKEDALKLAKANGVSVISTELNSFMAARILPLSVPAEFVMTKENIDYISINDTLPEVKEKMSKTRYRSYPVLENDGAVIGNLSRYHLLTGKPKKLVLVDHNEKAQSIDNIEEAEIIEIVDHHRIDPVTTNQPVYFRNEPVGSTATIISEMYFEHGVRPTKETAGLLASAIISDTLLFRSPTTTETDKRMLERMAIYAEIEPEIYAEKMFKKGTSLAEKTPTEILNMDVKEFKIADKAIKIAQVFTLDKEQILNKKAELLKEMGKIRDEKLLSNVVLIITDIFKESSIVFVVGEDDDKIAAEFGQKVEESEFVAEGLMSRKKQMVPKVTLALKKN